MDDDDEVGNYDEMGDEMGDNDKVDEGNEVDDDNEVDNLSAVFRASVIWGRIIHIWDSFMATIQLQFILYLSMQI